MPTRDGYAAGTPCWTDLGAGDVDAMVGFYTDIFGWTSPPADEEHGPYRMFQQDGHLVAGVGAKQDPSTATAWTVYIATDDADATARTAQERGGTLLVGPISVGEPGRMAILTDPAGIVFGLWEAGTTPGATLVNEPVSMTWTQLGTTDPDACAPFYGAVFGWQASPSQAGTTQFTLPGTEGPIAGMSQTESSNAWRVIFGVPDADALAAGVDQRGGSVAHAIEDAPWGRMGALADPEGAQFGVVTMA
jgi:uncharacterized protein